MCRGCRNIPTRGYNITQSSAPDDGHMAARNMFSNYYKRNKEYKNWHLVRFSYPHWITMHGQPHIRRINQFEPLCAKWRSVTHSQAGRWHPIQNKKKYGQPDWSLLGLELRWRKDRRKVVTENEKENISSYWMTLKGKEGILEFEGGSTRSHCV